MSRGEAKDLGPGLPRRPGVAVLGGCFNPLHVGHLRLAIEIREAMGELVDRVEFLPAAHPPHKAERRLLPFQIRVDLIREAIAPYPWLGCCELEGERETPSYTWESLGLYAERAKGREIFFVLGSPDYEQIPFWYHGLELPERCSLVVAPRGVYPREAFEADTRRMWPDARPAEPCTRDGWLMRTKGSRMLYQPLPWLEISASLIRERFLEGRCIDYLVPKDVVELLESKRKILLNLWS